MKVSFDFQFSRYDAFYVPKPLLEPRSPEDEELVVINSKTQCPDCGRVVSVNVKRGFLYSHAPKGGAGNCPIRTPYYLRIESAAQPTPKLPTVTSGPAQPQPTKEPIYFDKSDSVRTVSGGSPGMGRNRRL